MGIRNMRTLRAAVLGLAAATAFALGGGRTANATFNFNPSGGASTGTYSVNALQFGAGNALATTSIPLTVGSTFQVYFQTHLTGLTGGNAPAVVPGLNSTYQVTEVATLTERVTSVTTTPGTGTTATFSLVPGQNNQIALYYNPAVVFNDAAGTGFTAGTKIATLNPTSFISSQFTDTSTTAGGTNADVMFNQTGQGNAQTATAHTGSGSTNIANNVAAGYNAAFFQPPSGTPALTSSIFNSNLNSVFDALPPSLQFTNPISSTTVTPMIGSINGQTGPDFQLQVSGFTQSFTVVPEPSSFCLTALGLGGALALVRRRRTQVG